MPDFPMFVNLKGKRILVLGGGKVAARKVKKLAPFGGRITVVAPQAQPELEAMPGVEIRRHGFRPADLWPRPAMVIAATDDRQVNARASRLCRRFRIPVNVADNGPESSFLFPALVNQGDFSAGISTGGASPTAAVYFKERLEELVPERLEEILDYLEEKRAELKRTLPDQSARAAAMRELLDTCLELGRPPDKEQEIPFRGAVTLVGAGCGRADLITVRGLRAIQRCQAVVYDDLIDPKLLEAAPETARRIYMGKRSGVAGATQAQINEQLIALAREGLRVVRLKGGDPYLFGRGGEEMLALREAGIPCREIPGIPSAIGIPAEAGIPVTHRGLSRGLHIVTGHTADTAGGLPGGMAEMAGLPGTLVFLMGLGSLERIAEELMAGGKAGSTPAAVISGGNSPNPACVRGNLQNIAARVRQAGVQAPAVILIGAVAALRLGSRDKPLAGVRVGITGTEAVAEKQKALLEALGAETEWVSRCGIEPRPMGREPEQQGWLVFTSANGVGVFFGSRNPEDWKNRKFAVIGPATAAALEALGIRAAVCPGEYTGEALAQAIAHAAEPGEPVTLLRSSQGGSALPELLEAAGHPVTDIPLYDPVPAGELGATDGLDYLTFASAGGVQQFFRRGGVISPGVKCVCIGKNTEEALRRHFAGPSRIAKEATVESMVETIAGER